MREGEQGMAVKGISMAMGWHYERITNGIA